MGEFNSSNLNSYLTPTGMHDSEGTGLPYGGELAAFTGSVKNWDYEKTHIRFNENTGGNSCSDISSFTNITITQAAAATGLGAAAGSQIPIVGNAAGGIIGFFIWYYNWSAKCK